MGTTVIYSFQIKNFLHNLTPVSPKQQLWESKLFFSVFKRPNTYNTRNPKKQSRYKGPFY